MRYFVTNENLIPLHAQPENGYTKMQAIERAQREAVESSRLFSLPMAETVKWYHIVDSNFHYCKELDSAI